MKRKKNEKGGSVKGTCWQALLLVFYLCEYAMRMKDETWDGKNFLSKT